MIIYERNIYLKFHYFRSGQAIKNVRFLIFQIYDYMPKKHISQIRSGQSLENVGPFILKLYELYANETYIPNFTSSGQGQQ